MGIGDAAVSNRRLDLSSLSKLSSTLRALPVALAQEVAKRAAPVISQFAKESFDASKDPYGAPWAPAVNGEVVTLRATRALEKFVHYVAIGTKLRVALGVKYAKYQIGKRPIYPRAGLLPAKYSEALRQITQEAAKDYLGGGSNAP